MTSKQKIKNEIRQVEKKLLWENQNSKKVLTDQVSNCISDVEIALQIATQKIQKVERDIDSLSYEEQKFLLERLKKRMKDKSSIKLNKSQLEKEIQEMPSDPEIQAEIAAINKEFLITEMDGLSNI